MSWEAVRCVLEHLSEHAHGLDQLVLLHLANHARHGQDGGGITVGRRTLARKTGVSDRTVKDALARLLKAGLVDREGRGPNNTYRHRIVLCPLCKRSSHYSASGVARAPKWSSSYPETRRTQGEPPAGLTRQQRLAWAHLHRGPDG